MSIRHLDRLLEPRSVAVIGASERVGSLRDVPVVGVACCEQTDDVVQSKPFAGCGALDDFSHAGIDTASKH